MAALLAKKQEAHLPPRSHHHETSSQPVHRISSNNVGGANYASLHSRGTVTRVCAFLVLLFVATSAVHEEIDYVCPTTNNLVVSTLVCDGTVHCPKPPEPRYDDEWGFCGEYVLEQRGVFIHYDPHDRKMRPNVIYIFSVPAPYLQNVSVVASEVTGTSVLLSWSGARRRIPDHPLKLAGYFVTGKSKDHLFQDRVHRYRLSHRVEWLKPLTWYTFIVRPYYTDDGVSKQPRQIGRATSLQIRTLSADHVEMSVEVVNSTAAVVTWRALEPAKLLSFQLYEVPGDGNDRLIMSAEYHGLKTASSTYNIIIGTLKPWTYYMASLQDCSAKHCNEVGNRTFLTPPDQLPKASVTRIESRRPGSLEMEWAFPQVRRPHHGFRVRCCEDQAVTCSLVFTNQTSFAVEGLAQDTVYNVDVRAQLKIPGGRVVLGPPETASVVTWSDLPVLVIKHEASINDLHGASVLSWTARNSSVRYFEYRLDEKRPWTPCNESPDCNVTVAREEPDLFPSGFITVRHYKRAAKANVGFRGCNTHGCGNEYRVEVTSHLKDSSWGPVLEVHPRNFTAVLQLKNIGVKGFEVKGRCGEDWEIRYEKSMHQQGALDNDQYIQVQGLPLKAEECEFFMRTYETHGNITHYDTRPYVYPEE